MAEDDASTAKLAPTKLTTQPPLPQNGPYVRAMALGIAVVSPICLLIPPRRIDMRNVTLLMAFGLAVDRLVLYYTGQSLIQRSISRISTVRDMGVPEGALRTRDRLRHARDGTGPSPPSTNAAWTEYRREWEREREHMSVGEKIMDQIREVMGKDGSSK